MAPIQGILRLARVAIPALVLCGSTAFADSADWQIRKSSGDVWLDNAGSVQQVSLSQDASLKPGDSIRTGRTGRVLLVRGEETILVSPNTAITLPKEQKDNLSTTIVQQTGSILLEVEKRNVKHFQVETPYLAAVVKGTQFQVTVGATGANVSVVRGQVEVADFRSGQIAQVMPGQIAASLAHGRPGLALSGSGQFSPIQHGAPRAPSVERISVPRAGLMAPRGSSVASRSVATGSPHAREARQTRGGGLRISAPIGEVRLNVHRSSNGFAHAAGQSIAATTRNAQGSAGNGNQGNGNQTGASGVSTAAPSAIVAAPLGSNAVQGTSNGNGNSGAVANANPNGQAVGSGNGNGNAGSNGNAGGNGNGNGGGNGNAGGNGNGNGGGNGNAGGNGNGNGGGNGNAGGNGNGNGGSNGNAGGNGNGNGGRSGNAGGNGNGNGIGRRG